MTSLERTCDEFLFDTIERYTKLNSLTHTYTGNNTTLGEIHARVSYNRFGDVKNFRLHELVWIIRGIHTATNNSYDDPRNDLIYVWYYD